MAKRLLIILALVVTVALPFVLRPKRTETQRADVTLVVITPHNEAIRQEFGAAFQQWYRARTGKTVALDWRVIGGTSEINRFIEGEYVAAFRNYWEGKQRKGWSTEVQAGFANAKLPADAPAAVQEARAAFLASDVGCGIDVFFGGGSYDLAAHAAAGRLVPAAVFKLHPEWFVDGVIPRSFSGEQYWDGQGRWFGNVVSSYGILCNRDSLTRLGLKPPQVWADLADPRYVGELALADPTKSSSIAKAFENLIQQQMQLRLAALRAAHPAADEAALEAQAVREGWREGLRIIQRLGANARYFTDSSQKPPIDVAQGDCAAGICIDFYGRAAAEVAEHRSGGPGRLVFVTPHGGTVNSVDPIGLLRGAPHREAAELFLEFTLSLDGQKLWNFKPGTDGGPRRYALRRMPVRADFYQHTEWQALRSDPEADPYEEKDGLVYQPAWTGSLFRETSLAIRVMCLDTHPELSRAWRAIIAAGMPPSALEKLGQLDAVGYDVVRTRFKAALAAKDRTEELRLATRLGAEFRRIYAEAEAEANRVAALRR
ncbi:MAG: extracellular solute-binding protein [Verrucomicrobia bacterium]|nr:extracellular solute-binding protein [Verrucomicrobiota bacterium]